ncbi:MAG: hypothetical protein WC341_02305 [Bacteroidales bacterium]|jgi:hypothetical protein
MNNSQINFDSDFLKALEYCQERKLYLGVGNPNEDILILGKELIDDSLSIQENGEKNIGSWNDIISNKRNFSNINHLEDNALFPWKGQQFIIRKVGENGKITGEEGTSATWYFYQYLVDLILNKSKKAKNDDIDFHKYCFQSELNQLNAKMSYLIPKYDKIRIKSIKDREQLFAQPFFNKFKIVIIACGHYQRDYSFNIEETFKVNWLQPTINISKGNWFNLHTNNDRNNPKIVIHTRQFSSGISSELIKAIAEKCKELKDNNNFNC